MDTASDLRFPVRTFDSTGAFLPGDGYRLCEDGELPMEGRPKCVNI